MKKIIIIALIVVIAVSASYLIGTGYIINGGIYLGEYNVSEDGKEITFNIQPMMK